MPDSFFTSQKSRKRKRSEPNGSKSSRKSETSFKRSKSKNHTTNGPTTSKRKRQDEELESDQTNDEDGGVEDMDLRVETEDEHAESEEEDPDETPAEKRLRLAQLYLQGVKEDMGLGEFDAAEIDKELISARLKQDVMEHSGKAHLFVADSYDLSTSAPLKRFTKGHRLSVTAAVASQSGRYLFTSGKEGHIIKWDLSTGKQIKQLYKLRPSSNSKGKGKAVDSDTKGHTDEVLALALSYDGKYLVSGGRDRKVGVWDAEKCEWIKCFVGPSGHKDGISAACFRQGTHQLYTASFDRTLKVYDLSPNVMGYVETLFGHQDHVLGLDALRSETCVSVGARDTTVRYWKIVEETQLIFRGGGRSKVRDMLEGGLGGDEEEHRSGSDPNYVEGSLECVAMIDENTFVSGGNSGTISLWTTQKKKPIFKQPLAHGLNETLSSTSGVILTPRWITSLASLRYSDLFASGSWNDQIQLWKLDPKLKSFTQISTLTISGVVNSLQFLTPPKDTVENMSWVAPSLGLSQADDDQQADTVTRSATTLKPVLLVAGIGQEHRLGRWISTKDRGGKNESVVFALLPRSRPRTPLTS
ncbi:WD40 repeat-like protein [Marasmius fiardii PR-910]|nr:WD40 repeat-like protein [Marasmius fiardii PR-910]